MAAHIEKVVMEDEYAESHCMRAALGESDHGYPGPDKRREGAGSSADRLGIQDQYNVHEFLHEGRMTNQHQGRVEDMRGDTRCRGAARCVCECPGEGR